MKRTLAVSALYCAVSLFFSFNAYSQLNQVINNLAPVNNTEQCGFDQLHQQRMQIDPVYLQNTINFNNAMETYNPDGKVSSTPYRVPVVVHVMETGNSLTAITDAQIREAIKQLNERYRKVPGTPGDGAGVDVELEFALAVRDPGGNCTNGIVRFDMTGNPTYMASGVFRNSAGITDAALKAASVWDQTQYYNIWLVSEIDNNNGGSGIQGYAYFASAHGTSVDGAVILCSNFKNSSSTTGTHELGHAFNLYHTFQDDGGGGTCPPNGNCSTDGDRVCDTPPHMRSSSDCVVGTNPCDGGSSTELFIHNYMDYSSDACQSEFTAGQKTRVSAAMTTIRTSFLESNGNLSLVPPVAPIVAFEASGSYVCSGNSIQFTDLSSCTPNTFLDTTYWTGITFNWTFTSGANVYTSTLQNPLMTFPVSGVYDVSLTITNGIGSNTHTELGFVVVGSGPIGACTTTTTNTGNYWNTVYNVDFNTINNGTSQYVNAGYTDFACAANTVVTEGTTHTMSIDLSAGGSAAEVTEVYIDYDNSGTFEAGELVLSGTTGGTSTTATVTGNVTIPTNAVENTLLRMRVYGEAGSLTNNERNCVSNMFIGDVEDYGVYIMSACVTPTITVSGTTDPLTCGASNGTITISGTGSGDVTWTGAASGTASGVSLPYTITGLAAGSYDIQYGISGCISTSVNSVLSDPGAPTTPVITASGATTFCAGQSVTLTSSYASGNTWSTTETTQSIVVNSSGSYTVSYTDGGGCTAISVPTVVTVNALPVAPNISPVGPTEICPGGSLNLSSSQASGNTWSTTETTQVINVTTAGSYTVQYTDGNGCQSLASTPSVVTLATGGAALPVSEGFVSATFPPTNWTINNGGNAITWVRSATVGNAPTAGNSAMFDNYNVNMNGDQDDLVMEPVTMVGLTSAQLEFDVAYARYDGANFDQLDVLVSSDCGQTFNTVYSKSGTTLATDPDNTGSYAPGTWRTETIDLSAYVGSAKVDVIFRNISGWGNNLYLDNINLTGVGGCTEPDVPTVTYSPATVCDGNMATLSFSGSLNDATEWFVYTGSCGGTFVGSTAASSMVVTPTGPSTTYYVRGEGGCSTPATCGTVVVTVTPNEDASFSYGASTYCANDSDPTPTITGTGSGTFTSTAGLSINASTGAIDLSVSTPGSYTVTYTTPGTCSASSNISVDVVANPSAPVVTVVDNCGISTLTATGSNLVWSTAETTSSITVATAGTYTVTQTVGGCTSTAGSGVANPTAIPSAPIVTVVDNCGTSTLTATGTNLVWSTTETTSSITVGTAGTYTVTQTVGGCTSAAGSGVANPTAIPSAPVVTVVDNCGTSTLTATGSNLVWSTAETTSSITVGTAGTYTVTQTVGGCTSAAGSGVTNPTAIPSAPVVTVVDNCGTSTLTTAGTNLVWSTAETTSSITVGTAGTYTVTQTVGGCTSFAGSGVANPQTSPIIASGTVTDPSTCGGNDGSIVITGSGTGVVSWIGDATGNSGTITLPYTINGLGAGSYDVTFNDGCTSNTVSETLSDPGAPSAPVVTVVDNCGTSTLTAIGSSLLWSTTETTSSITIGTAGTYTVTQTVAGCTSLPGSGVANPIAIPSAPVVTVVDNCGSSTLTATGSNLVWSTTETTSSISVATAGTYTVTQTVGGCTSTAGSGVANPTAIPAAPIVTVVDNCGTSTLTATGSSLVWSTAETTSSITVGTAGTYTVTQTVGGCTSVAGSGVANPTAIPSAPVVTVVDNCGTSTLTATGSNLLWSTAETTSSITVGTAGTYTVTQTVGGCTSVAGSGVANPTAIPSAPVVTVVDGCGGSVLSATGTNLLWSTTEITSSITVGTAGTYTVTQSVGGCTSAAGTGVATPGTAATIASGAVTDPSICGGTNGSIVVTGTGTGVVSWTGTATGNTGAVTLPYTITGLGAGTYNILFNNGCPSNTIVETLSDPGAPVAPVVTVVDNCGASILTATGSNLLWSTAETTSSITVGTAGTFTVTQTVAGCTSLPGTGVANPTAIPATPIVLVIDNCGNSNLTATGSNLLWSTAETTPSITVGTAGTYTVTQTVGGCTSLPGSGVANPTAIPATPIVLVIDNCGSSNLTATGTNLLWSTAETTTSITVGTAGTYTVTQTVGGCTSAAGSGVANPTAIPSAPVVTVLDNCGTSTLTSTGSNLVWSTAETTSSITVGTAGAYTVTQTVGGCTSTAGSGVANPTAIPATPIVSVIDNCGSSTLTATGTNLLWSTTETTPSITVGAAGTYSVMQTVGGCASLPGSGVANPAAIPSAPVVTVVDNCGTSILTATGTNLLWSTAETTPSITVGTAGTYTVTQTVGGCTSAAGSGAANPTAIPSAPVVTVVDNCGTSILTATGTNLLWSTAETTSSITVGTAGTYTVTQTVGGCTSTVASGVAIPIAIPTTPIVLVVDDCGSSTLTATGTNLLWSTAETTPSITVGSAGTYTVTQSVGGCASLPGSGIANPIAIPSAPVVTVVDNCGSSTLTATGSNLLWSTTETTPSILVLGAGTYTVTQTVAGCVSTAGSGVANPIALPSAPVVTVMDLCGNSVLMTSGSNLLWSTTETTPSITVGAAGTYTVTQTVGGCTSLLGSAVANPLPFPTVPVVTASGPISFCEGGSVDLTSSETTNIQWSTLETTPSVTIDLSGTYTVTFTGANGCSSTSTPMVVTENPLPVVSVGPYADICSDDGFFTITGGSPAGGTYSGNGIVGGIFNPSTAGVGTHTILYEFTDGNGCYNSDSTTITVNDCSGIDELNDIGLVLYPNPVSEILTVQTDGVVISEIKIYDAAGRLIEQSTINSEQTVINISDYATGLYTIELVVENEFYRRRITKQ